VSIGAGLDRWTTGCFCHVLHQEIYKLMGPKAQIGLLSAVSLMKNLQLCKEFGVVATHFPLIARTVIL
jgi:hypothetical protein